MKIIDLLAYFIKVHEMDTKNTKIRNNIIYVDTLYHSFSVHNLNHSMSTTSNAQNYQLYIFYTDKYKYS